MYEVREDLKWIAPKCWVCMDKGFVPYEIKGCFYISHCVCSMGNEYAYDGRMVSDETRRTNYVVSNVASKFDIKVMEKQNYEEWMSYHREG